MIPENKLSVAVITPSIGRKTLINTIECVKKQTYPCKHYIFVDGPQYHQQVQEMVKDYPDVVVSYLGMNTGAKGLCNSVVNAIAPFTVTEDVICYADDDNWISEDHVETLINALTRFDAEYAYNLRYFVNEKCEIICADHIDSIGFWKIDSLSYNVNINIEQESYTLSLNSNIGRKAHLVDTNCYAIKRDTARKLALSWMSTGDGNDIAVTRTLISSNMVGVNTGKHTVYYLADINKRELMAKSFFVEQFPKHTLTDDDIIRIKSDIIRQRNEAVKNKHSENGKLPWERLAVFKNGKLEFMDE